VEVTGPFAVTVGAELDVTPPAGSSKFDRVILANASPLACQVNSTGVAQWLQPWSADVYACDAGNPAEVTPSFTTSAGSAAGQITATWLLPGDPLTGTYPVTLTAQAIAANIVQDLVVDQTTLAIIDGTVTLPLTVPAGIQSLIISGTLTEASATPTPVVFTSEAGGYPTDAMLFPAGDEAYNNAVIDITAGAAELLVTAYAADSIVLAVWGSGFPARMIRPDRNTDTYWGPYQTHATIAAAGATATLLRAPQPGLVWEISNLNAFAVSAAAGSGYFALIGLTTGAAFAASGQVVPVGTAGPAQNLLINEGIQLRNDMAASTANAAVWARQIPIGA
jgi:hypothetical protein